MTGVEDVIRQLVARLGDAADFHFAPKYVDCIVEEYVGKLATLERGTCHIKPWEMERDTGFYDCMECECGYVADVGDWAEWHFCPNCGRRCVG